MVAAASWTASVKMFIFHISAVYIRCILLWWYILKYSNDLFWIFITAEWTKERGRRSLHITLVNVFVFDIAPNCLPLDVLIAAAVKVRACDHSFSFWFKWGITFKPSQALVWPRDHWDIRWWKHLILPSEPKLCPQKKKKKKMFLWSVKAKLMLAVDS